MRMTQTLPTFGPGILLCLAACGGGGTGPTPPPTNNTPPPTVTATPPPVGVKPTVKIVTDTRAGRSPLRVSFSLCDSRDGSGGTALDYLASFDGEPLLRLGGCGFSHEYRSTGVTVFDTQLCVQDRAGQQTCETTTIKTYIGLDIRVDKTGCAGTVVAVASESTAGFAGVHRMASLDRVEFEAFTATGQSLGKRDGTKQGSDWSTGTWNVNNTTKLRVIATGFARNTRGDDVPEADRPACGS
jgi:hypothetical protein